MSIFCVFINFFSKLKYWWKLMAFEVLIFCICDRRNDLIETGILSESLYFLHYFNFWFKTALNFSRSDNFYVFFCFCWSLNFFLLFSILTHGFQSTVFSKRVQFIQNGTLCLSFTKFHFSFVLKPFLEILRFGVRSLPCVSMAHFSKFPLPVLFFKYIHTVLHRLRLFKILRLKKNVLIIRHEN